MNRLQTRVVALTMTCEDSPCSIARWRCVRYFPSRSSFAFLLGAVALILPIASYPQSLNDAVTSQLEIRDFVPCALLRDGQPNPEEYLTGELLTICQRGGGSAGTTPATSTGGGAATPTTLPSIVQQRLREARSEEKKPVKKVTAASADAAGRGSKQRAIFIAAESESLDRDVTTFEDGYDSDIQRLVVGVDIQATAQWVAGLAFDASKQDGDFVGGGDFEVRSYGIVGFGLFLPTDKTFVQFYGGIAQDSYDRGRFGVFTDLQSDGSPLVPPTASGIQNADYDVDQYSVGLLGGYDFPIRNVTLSPFAGVDWKRTDFGTYSETGISGLELTFHDDEKTSLQSSIGLQASVELRPGAWVVVPKASGNWKHEFENEQRDVVVSFVGDNRAKPFSYQTEQPDRDWGEINVGIIAVSPGGLQVFGNYSTLVGHAFFDSDAVTIGLRLPF